MSTASWIRSLLPLTVAGMLAACGGGGGGGGTTTLPKTTAAPVTLSAQSLSFTSVGSSSAQTVTASQTGFTGAFTATSQNCSGIATIATSGTKLTVTPLAAGACGFSIAGMPGSSATLTVSVTTSAVGVQ